MKRRSNKELRKRIEQHVKHYGYFNGELPELPDEKHSLEDRIKFLLNQYIKGKPALVIMLQEQIKKAIAGDRGALELLLDRAYGKTTLNIKTDSPPAINIQHNVITVDQFKAIQQTNEDRTKTQD